MQRPAFLAGSIAALSAPALAAGPLTTVLIGGTADPGDMGPLLWAVHSGIFSRLGLDVQFQRLNNGAAVSAAVAGGAINVGKASVFSLIVGHARGIPFQLESVGAMYLSDNPTIELVVAKGGPIQGARDLNGKTLGTPGLGDVFSTASLAWIDANGGDSKQVKLVELPSNATLDAIAASRVDGAVMNEPFLGDALASEKCRSIGKPLDVIAKRFGVTYYFCTPDYIAKNADALARLRRGLGEATTYVLRHPTDAAPLIAQFTGLSPELILSHVQPIASGIDVSFLQPTIDFAARVKMIPAPFSARDLIDPAALHA